MKAKLICYTLGKISSTLRNRFKRDLSGYKDYSNKCKYNYARKGMLDKIPHHKPIRSVIIIKNQHKKQIEEFLKQYKAKYSIFDIEIEEQILKT